jgi:hypothetical protein
VADKRLLACFAWKARIGPPSASPGITFHSRQHEGSNQRGAMIALCCAEQLMRRTGARVGFSGLELL